MRHTITTKNSIRNHYRLVWGIEFLLALSQSISVPIPQSEPQIFWRIPPLLCCCVDT